MKNKTKKIIRITFAILLVVLIQFIGVTYAKYITGEKGTGQAEVAKWAFNIREAGQQTSNIKLVDTTNKDTLVDGKIAPGTSGKIEIVLDAEGAEVDMDYMLEFTNEQNKPDNLYFNYNGTIYKSIEELNSIIGQIKFGDETRTRVISVVWHWPYTTGTTKDTIAVNDKIDTENANTITEYTFDIVATATQSE